MYIYLCVREKKSGNESACMGDLGKGINREGKRVCAQCSETVFLINQSESWLDKEDCKPLSYVQLLNYIGDVQIRE